MLPVSARSFAHITMVIFDTKNEEQTRSAYDRRQAPGRRLRQARLRRIPRPPRLHGPRGRPVLVQRPRLPALLRDDQGRARPQRDPLARQAGHLAAARCARREASVSAPCASVAIAEDRRAGHGRAAAAPSRPRARRWSRSPSAGSAAPTCTSATCRSCSRPGTIPGHELSGRIAALGDGVAAGRSATASCVLPFAQCGECELCRSRQRAGLPATRSPTASGWAPGAPAATPSSVLVDERDAVRAPRRGRRSGRGARRAAGRRGPRGRQGGGARPRTAGRRDRRRARSGC